MSLLSGSDKRSSISNASGESVVLDHSLASYLVDGPADSSVLRIFRRVLEAVEAIRAAGSSHLPLSPQTIRLDESDRPHIKSSNRAHESAETIAFGSVKYSAPEAFADIGQSSSPESADCYVLGFMFYEILLGRRLFLEQFAAIENGPPSLWLKWHADRSAKARPLREIRPNLGHFASVIDGMIEKDLRKRISSLSQVLSAFSTVEVQTAYNINTSGRRIAKSKFANWRAALLLLVIAAVVMAVIVSREIKSPRSSQPLRPVAKPAPAAQRLPPAPREPAPAPVQPLPPAAPEPELQVESHLKSEAFLLLDDREPAALEPDILFTRKVSAGPHTLTVKTRSSALLKLPLNVAPSGEISFPESPQAGLIRYTLLPSNTGSTRIVLEPTDRRLLIPVEISANVPDAAILINGEKFTRQLNKGIAVVRFPPGVYRIRLVHSGYQDSAEQNVVVDGNSEPRQQLNFALSPIVGQSAAPAAAAPSAPSPTATNAEQTLKPIAKITFEVQPENAQISCRREDDSTVQDCPNNQPCLLRAGTYEVTAKAGGFKTAINHISAGAGDEKSYEWKLEAAQLVLSPSDFFENGPTWTVGANGWWTHEAPGYSFLRRNRGVFAFDIAKPSGIFASKKVSFVVNYKNDGSRVLYTIDEHKMHRNERAPGLVTTDFSVPHEMPQTADYRFVIELSADRVIIRNASGKILDNLPLANAGDGKVGFSGKVKLRVVQARYSQ